MHVPYAHYSACLNACVPECMTHICKIAAENKVIADCCIAFGGQGEKYKFL